MEKFYSTLLREEEQGVGVQKCLKIVEEVFSLFYDPPVQTLVCF